MYSVDQPLNHTSIDLSFLDEEQPLPLVTYNDFEDPPPPYQAIEPPAGLQGLETLETAGHIVRNLNICFPVISSDNPNVLRIIGNIMQEILVYHGAKAAGTILKIFNENIEALNLNEEIRYYPSMDLEPVLEEPMVIDE
jgi:hypothetical protein